MFMFAVLVSVATAEEGCTERVGEDVKYQGYAATEFSNCNQHKLFANFENFDGLDDCFRACNNQSSIVMEGQECYGFVYKSNKCQMCINGYPDWRTYSHNGAAYFYAKNCTITGTNTHSTLTTTTTTTTQDTNDKYENGECAERGTDNVLYQHYELQNHESCIRNRKFSVDDWKLSTIDDCFDLCNIAQTTSRLDSP